MNQSPSGIGTSASWTENFSNDSRRSSSSSSENDDSSSSSSSSSSSISNDEESSYSFSSKEDGDLYSNRGTNHSLNSSVYSHGERGSNGTRRYEKRTTSNDSGLPQYTMRNRKRSTISWESNQSQKDATSKSPRRHRRTRAYQSKRKSSDGREETDYSVDSIGALYMKGVKSILSKKTSILLVFSIITWLYVQFHFASDAHNQPIQSGKSQSTKDLQKKLEHIRKRREQNAFQALGSAASNFMKNVQGKNFKKAEKESQDGYSSAQDRLPQGCVREKWQNGNFQNCNTIHDIDLRQIILTQLRRKKITTMRDLFHGDKSKMANMTNFDMSWQDLPDVGYVGGGLWRQVWKVQPSLRDEDAVLKVMRQEHDITPRNFDRHRRDALVMEVLTYSRHVVDIYGFCGNTVLTEFVGATVDEFLYDPGRSKYSYPDRFDIRGKDDTAIYDSNNIAKIELAIDLVQGIHDLHEHNIVHADLQSRQFLIHPTDGVKVNDFNRCRLLPVYEKDNSTCKIRIPSAPGGNRSPEEYELTRIDTKADVFSTANVLFGILTSQRPWSEGKDKDVLKNDVRKNIMKGNKPPIDDKFRVPGTLDAMFADVILKAYEYDPDKRYSAAQILQELKKIKEQFLEKG